MTNEKKESKKVESATVRTSEQKQEQEHKTINAPEGTPEAVTGEIVPNGIQTENHGLVVGFTKEQIEAYDRITGDIEELQRSTEKTVTEIAFKIHNVYNHKLYKIDGYRDIYGYSEAKFGYSRGYSNNLLNLADRFGTDVIEGKATGDKCRICDRYADYNHSQLIAMLGHEDKELSDIKPDMSVRDIKKALKAKDDHVENPIEEGDQESMAEMIPWSFVLDKEVIFSDCKRKKDDFKMEVLYEYLYKNKDRLYEALKKGKLYIVPESDYIPKK